MSSNATEVSLQLSNGLKINGLSWGSPDQPKILALHGWLDNAATYTHLGAMLSEYYHVVAMDFAGHGLSGHRPNGVRYHLLDNVDDVILFADALGWESFYLMGHSMGAGVSTYTTACFPERIKALILLEGIGTYTTPAEDAPDVLRKAIKDLERTPNIKKPIYPDLEAAIGARTQAVGIISREAAKALCQRGTELVPGGVTWTSDPRLKMTSAMRLTESLVEAFIKKIECPTLFVGAAQGFMDKMPNILQRLELLKQATVVTVPGNHHHHLELDTFEYVAQAVLTFLSEL
ncbi:MAG: alpha/beta hydrolase [Pseudomonadales bacterium]|nr:alpha/beta hydrolase [Pseudomonadales bacterium]